MSTQSSIDWRFLRKHFLISFVGALLFAIIIYFGCHFISGKHQGILLFTAAVLLWCVCAWRSLRSVHILHVLAIAAGLTWGFLFSLSATFSIRNGHLSVWWPTMVPGLLLIPVIATVTVLPFFGSLGAMNDSRKRYLTFFSWFSLAAPFVAYGLCILACDHPDLWSWIPWIAPMAVKAVFLTRRYGFLVAAVIAAFVLFGDIRFKRWWLVWLPLVGMIFTYLLYIWAPDLPPPIL